MIGSALCGILLAASVAGASSTANIGCQFIFEGDVKALHYYEYFHLKSTKVYATSEPSTTYYAGAVNTSPRRWYIMPNATTYQRDQYGYFDTRTLNTGKTCIPDSHTWVRIYQDFRQNSNYWGMVVQPTTWEERVCRPLLMSSTNPNRYEYRVVRPTAVYNFNSERFLGEVKSFAECLRNGAKKRFANDGQPFTAFGLRHLNKCYGYSGSDVEVKPYGVGGAACVLPKKKAPCHVIVETPNNHPDHYYFPLKGVVGDPALPFWVGRPGKSKIEGPGNFGMLKRGNVFKIYKHVNRDIDTATFTPDERNLVLQIPAAAFDAKTMCFADRAVVFDPQYRQVGRVFHAKESDMHCGTLYWRHGAARARVVAAGDGVPFGTATESGYLSECVKKMNELRKDFSAIEIQRNKQCIGYMGLQAKLEIAVQNVSYNYSCLPKRSPDMVLEYLSREHDFYLYLNGTTSWSGDMLQWDHAYSKSLSAVLRRKDDKLILHRNATLYGPHDGYKYGFASAIDIKMGAYGLAPDATFFPLIGDKRRPGRFTTVTSDTERDCVPPLTPQDEEFSKFIKIQRSRVVSVKEKTAANPFAEAPSYRLGRGEFLSDCLRLGEKKGASDTGESFTAYSLRYSGCYGYTMDVELAADPGGYIACKLPKAPPPFIIENDEDDYPYLIYLKGIPQRYKQAPIWRSPHADPKVLVSAYFGTTSWDHSVFAVYPDLVKAPTKASEAKMPYGYIKLSSFDTKTYKMQPNEPFQRSNSPRGRIFPAPNGLPCKPKMEKKADGKYAMQKVKARGGTKRRVTDASYLVECALTVKTQDAYKDIKAITIESNTCFGHTGDVQLVADATGTRGCMLP